MKVQAKFDKKNIHFEARPSHQICASMTSKLFDKALNESFILPRFIVIVPDWDILKYLDHNTFGVEQVIHKMISWMTNNIICAVEVKKDQLYKIQPGSVTSGEPKIIWVKMIQRMRTFEKILTVRVKYNSFLESCMAERR